MSSLHVVEITVILLSVAVILTNVALIIHIRRRP